MLRILIASAEMAPFAKEGGMGDVVGALAKMLSTRRHDVRVVMPLYGRIDRGAWEFQPTVDALQVPMGGLGRLECAVLEGILPDTKVPVYFIDYAPFYGRWGIYNEDGEGYRDNGPRFVFLSRAGLELCRAIGFSPQIIHIHDWHTAAIPVFLNTLYRDDASISAAATLLTIHNMMHQGVFDKSLMDVLGIGWEHFHFRELEFFDKVNLLKGGIYHATLINTVSPSYAREIRQPQFACSIEGVVRDRAADLFGILNGADYDEWDPETDPMIAARYSESDLSGKALCKADLQRTLGLPDKPAAPLFGLVSRLVKQKGIDLLAEALPHILDLDVQFALLGSGEPWSHVFFEELARAHPDRFACRIGFDETLAHKIIAGSDFFLMPSRFEPCGLTQMYAMRYGTLPVVRATGGLNDTVENFDEDKESGTGFKFHDLTGEALYNTLAWTLRIYREKPGTMNTLIARVMQQRFTWETAARKYEELYTEALGCTMKHANPLE
jgi:starch synthase